MNIGTFKITMPRHELMEKNAPVQSQPDEIQKVRFEIAELQRTLKLAQQELEATQSRVQQQELNFDAQRRAWQCELAEKQLLLQSRNAEIEQSRSEIASLRKRIRELELVRQQMLGSTDSHVELTQPQPGTRVAIFATAQKEKVHEAQKSFDNGLEESLLAGRRRLANGSQEFANARDEDFVLGEPRIADAQEISFARVDGRIDAVNAATDEKSSKIFGTRRWRIRGQKRRWRFLNGSKEAGAK